MSTEHTNTHTDRQTHRQTKRETDTYSIVLSAWQLDTRLFVLHVYEQAADMWQSVLEVVEICEKVHYRVTNLTIDRLSIADTHQWTRVV